MENLGQVLANMKETLRGTPKLPEEEKKPDCPICSGRGWLKTSEGKASPCNCQLAHLRKLPPGTFETFDPRAGTEDAIDACRAFCSNDRDWTMLTLSGPRGSGKTHLMAAVGRVLFSKGQSVHFVTAPTLLDNLRASYDEDEPLSFQEVFRRYAMIDVLLLDDLGQGDAKPWAIDKLTRLVDHRYGRELPTVISTNYLLEGPRALTLAAKWEATLADRVFDDRSGRVRVSWLTCASYRTGKKW